MTSLQQTISQTREDVSDPGSLRALSPGLRRSAKRMVERIVTAVVVAAFVSGCSTKGIRATDSVAHGAVSGDNVIRPRLFEVSIGGFFWCVVSG